MTAARSACCRHQRIGLIGIIIGISARRINIALIVAAASSTTNRGCHASAAHHRRSAS
jgi:hypothetical protein